MKSGQSSKKLSKLAAKVLKGKHIGVKRIKSLAGSVLTQAPNRRKKRS